MKKAYQICLEIFEERGYEIIEKDDVQILAMKKNGKQICAFMANTPKFNVERIQEYLSIMKQIDVWHAIIVYKDNATPVAKKVIEEANDLIIELFQEEELQNIILYQNMNYHILKVQRYRKILKINMEINFQSYLKQIQLQDFMDIIKAT